MAKPLRSPLLLENSNRAPDGDNPLHLTQTSASGLPGQPTTTTKEVEIQTPYKKVELWGHLINLAIRRRDLSIRRLVSKKVEKAFDDKDFKLAHLQQEVEALKVQLEAARPSRRKRVVPDPNKKFASIEQVHRAQIEVGRIEESGNEESGSESSESGASCIVVG